MTGTKVYAIIRNGDGTFYTSTVFGRYQTGSDQTHRNLLWIVLNAQKDRLIAQPLLRLDPLSLVPLVLITDTDQTHWHKASDEAESLRDLPTDQLLSWVQKGTVPQKILQKCLAIDAQYRFCELRSITSAKDIEDLDWVSGGFHDAHIAELREAEDVLYLRFEGCWACQIEVWFEGEVSYDASSRLPKGPEMEWLGSPEADWFGGTILLNDGFVYLIDDENARLEDITQGCCWFKARTMHYRVIPE